MLEGLQLAVTSTGQRNTLFFTLKKRSVVNGLQNPNKLHSQAESGDMESLATR
jgi:hypothetical protein